MTSHVLIKNIKRSRLSPVEIFIFDFLDDMYMRDGRYFKMIPDKTSVYGYFERELFFYHVEEPISASNQLVISTAYVSTPIYSKYRLKHSDMVDIISRAFNYLYNTNYPPSYFY